MSNRSITAAALAMALSVRASGASAGSAGGPPAAGGPQPSTTQMVLKRQGAGVERAC